MVDAMMERDEIIADLDVVEDVEKASLRLVTQAIYDFKDEAVEIFSHEQDLAGDIGEDITREALDRMGMPTIPTRLFGKIDYKRAAYVFQPNYATRQALFVDSKAEKIDGAGTATIQTSQTSLRIRQIRGGRLMDEAGGLETIATIRDSDYLVTTLFVKYNYTEDANRDPRSQLESISVLALPNGLLQAQYNPDAQHSFWRAGRNAPTLGEPFRVRISLQDLKGLANWRVQTIPIDPDGPFVWED